MHRGHSGQRSFPGGRSLPGASIPNLDLNEASVLLRPTWDAAGPLLRVSAPKAAAPVEGAAVAFDLLPEQCLCYR